MKDLPKTPLTEERWKTSFENYLNAFTTPSYDEQLRLLRASVSDQVVFANPGVEGSGHADVLRHIAAFQQRFPGSRFQLNWLVLQHGQALGEWTQLDERGVETVTAYSYAMFDTDGRVSRWAGFWRPGAVAAVYSGEQEAAKREGD